MSTGTQSARWLTFFSREIQEHRGSFVITPLAVAGALVLALGLSLVLANWISVMGDTLLEVILSEESSSMNISINIDDDSGEMQTIIVTEETVPEDAEDWNFSKEWKFKPRNPPIKDLDTSTDAVDSLNPLLNAVHSFMLLVLIIVTIGYLLNSFYQDRRDRSVLFWKSMPVSEWEEVLSKFAVAALVVPAIFVAASLILQTFVILVSMILVWSRDMDPFALVLGNVQFGRLLVNQIGGWLLTALWVAPLYAWLMLASAFARRSPFLVAITPVLGLILAEQILLGSSYVASAVGSHVPHFVGGGTAVGFYFFGPDWSSLNFLSLLSGLVLAVIVLAGVVYLRRYRFER